MTYGAKYTSPCLKTSSVDSSACLVSDQAGPHMPWERILPLSSPDICQNIPFLDSCLTRRMICPHTAWVYGENEARTLTGLA